MYLILICELAPRCCPSRPTFIGAEHLGRGVGPDGEGIALAVVGGSALKALRRCKAWGIRSFRSSLPGRPGRAISRLPRSGSRRPPRRGRPQALRGGRKSPPLSCPAAGNDAVRFHQVDFPLRALLRPETRVFIRSGETQPAASAYSPSALRRARRLGRIRPHRDNRRIAGKRALGGDPSTVHRPDEGHRVVGPPYGRHVGGNARLKSTAVREGNPSPSGLPPQG